MATKQAKEISGYAEILEDLEREIEIAEMCMHDYEKDIQRDSESVLSRNKERFYREAREGAARYREEKEYLKGVLNNLRDYEIADCNIESDIDRQLKALIAADDDELPEGSNWCDEVLRIKKQKSVDVWVYKVPKNVKVVVACDIETGKMKIAYAKDFRTRASMPCWKYQIVG